MLRDNGVKIVITHSWSLNMGDAAILLSLLEMLKSVSPASGITVLTSHPSFTRDRCPEIQADICGWPWPVPGSARPTLPELFSWPFVFIGNMLTALLYRLSGRKVFLLNGRFSEPLMRMMDCDVVISPGGHFIGQRYFFITSLGEIAMSKIMGKRFLICAQTIGPFDGWLSRRLVTAVLSLADIIVTRDSRSAGWLRREGLKNVHVTADLAFTFGHPQKCKKSRIVLSPKGVSKDSERYVAGMAKLARSLADESGYDVLILPTDSYDLGVQSEIAARLDGKASRVDKVLPPARIAALIGESSFIVSARMHAIILGSKSCTPFLAISDSDKFADILGSFYEGGCVAAGVDSTERALMLFRDRKELAKKMAAALPGLESKAIENAQILRKFLES